MFVLLVTLFTGSGLLAQTPSLRFSTQAGNTGHDVGLVNTTDASGNVYTAGYFSGTVDFDPGVGTANLTTAGASDLYVAKYDASGNYIWAFNVAAAATNTGRNFCNSIAVDGGGNVFIVGDLIGTADFDPGTGTANLTQTGTDHDMFVARYSPTGNYLWAFKIKDATGQGLAVDGSGNAVITGLFPGSVDFDPGAGTATLTATKPKGNSASSTNTDGFVARYTSAGAYVKAFAITGTGWAHGKSVAVDASGNIVITGWFSEVAGFNPANTKTTLTATVNGDIFVAKYSSAMSYLWAFRIGGTGVVDVADMAVDGTGALYVTGTFNSGTVDFNPGTGTANLTPGGANDLFLAKYSASGAYIWAESVGGSSSASYVVVTSLALDESGNPHLTGGFRGTVDFDPGNGTSVITGGNPAIGSTGYAFVAKYLSSGPHAWSFAVMDGSAPSYSRGLSIAIDGSDNIFVTGLFQGSADFDPSTAMASMTSAGGNDIFLASYHEPVLPKRTAGEISDMQMQVAPNPFTSAFTFRFDGTSAPARVEIIDMNGQVVETAGDVLPGGEYNLGAELPAGAYFVQIVQGETRRQVLVHKVR
jgi:hypothetical protein